jgi:hypothetical protein
MNQARTVLRTVADQDSPNFIAAMVHVFETTQSNDERMKARRWLMSGNGNFNERSFAQIVRQYDVALETEEA